MHARPTAPLPPAVVVKAKLHRLDTFAESPDASAAGQALHPALAAQKNFARPPVRRRHQDGRDRPVEKFPGRYRARGSGRGADRANQGPRTLLPTASRAASAALPAAWELAKTAGEVGAPRAEVSRAGRHSLRLAREGPAAAGGANTKLKLKRNDRYKLSGWIKTDGLSEAPAGATIQPRPATFR